MPTPTTPETVTLIKMVMSTIGSDDPITIGNAATGESCPLPPHIAEPIRQLLASMAAGRQVNVTEALDEFTPNEAADVLGVSRTYVKKLLDAGDLPYRTVGSHRRIPRADLLAYREAQRVRVRKGLDEIAHLDQQLGLADLNPSPEENPLVDGSAR